MAAPRGDSHAFLESAGYHAHWAIQLADTKANVLMAASAILAGLLVNQAVPTCNEAARYVLLLAVALALSCAGACLVALFPRTLPITHSSLNHYVAIAQFPDSAAYLAKVRGLTQEELEGENAHQIWEQARIQSVKFFWLRWGSRLFGLCLAATLVGTVWAHLPCA